MTDTPDDEPIVVTITSPGDIIGLLPHRLGFQPTESLVVMSLRGPRRRDTLVMRIDLPALNGSRRSHDRAVARELVERLERQGCEATVLVCYTEAPDPARGLVRAPLIRALRRELRNARVEVVEALLVRGSCWWSYLCADERCCPPTGTPVPAALTPAAAHYAAEAVARGQVVLADRRELEASVEAPLTPAAVQAWEELAGDVIGEVFERCSDDWPAGLEDIAASTVDRLARRWTEGDTTLDEREAVLVAASLVHKGTRDRVMILLLDHEPTVLEALFAELSRRTPDVAAAPVCTVLAWFAYAGGDGALAAVAAERALRVHPGYVLAELVLEGLEAMQPPAAIRQVTANVRAQLGEAS